MVYLPSAVSQFPLKIFQAGFAPLSKLSENGNEIEGITAVGSIAVVGSGGLVGTAVWLLNMGLSVGMICGEVGIRSRIFSVASLTVAAFTGSGFDPGI